jgi:hypothetical protein
MTIERKTGANSIHPKGGASSSVNAFENGEISVFRIKFCAEELALRLAAGHKHQLLKFKF